MNKVMTPEIIKKRCKENKIRKATEATRRKREKIDKMINSCEDKFISKLCELFINRWDCYAVQDNTNPLLFPTVYKELTIDIIKDSLMSDSSTTIGIHQIDDNKIKWLCYDIDKKHTIPTTDPKLLSDQIIKYLKEWYNLHGYLEPSGSPDSYHVWIFTEPTDVNTAINFHKEFKNRLKSIGIDIKPIEKGISRGNKDLGCMIKLPFNIQKKSNKRSELIADIFNITQEKIPMVQEPKNKMTYQTKTLRKGNYGGVVVCTETTNSVNYDIFENTNMCKNIISKIPEITKWINQAEPDRSKLDFMVIKVLAKVGISKQTIYKYLQTFPSSKTKIHERGYSYFDLTHSNVVKKINRTENEWYTPEI